MKQSTVQKKHLWIVGAMMLLSFLLLLALVPILGVTATERETRSVGVIAITADTFTDLGGGQTQASGDVWLGDHLRLSGAGDSVVFDSQTVTGTGTLAFRVEALPLFTGSFHAVGDIGIATPDAGITYKLSQIAGFAVDSSLSIAQVDIPLATVVGTTGLRLRPPGVDASATVSFTITPGPTFAGIMAYFELQTAGVTLQAPAGAALTNDGIYVPSVTLVVPALFGGATTTVNDLRVTPGSLSLGSAGVAFGLPDLLFGDGSKLKFTNNQASLTYDSGSNAYQLAISSTLSLNLPENQQDIGINVTLASVGGQPRLSGSLDGLRLSVAGTTLEMAGLTLNNDGLYVQKATLTLPPVLGSSQTSVYDVSVTGDGLVIGGATAQFHIPDVDVGDGQEVQLHRGLATLAIEGNAYKINVSADLVLNLPENSQTIAMAFSISAGQLNGTLDVLSLSVAGTRLQMTDVTLSNDGLAVITATLKLPAALGSVSATITNVQIGDGGLVFGSAGAEFDLPNVAFGGSGTAVAARAPGLAAPARVSTPVLSVTSNRATLGILGDRSGYHFQASGTLNINLPGNAQSRSFTFDLAYNAQSGFLIQGQLDALTLTVAGTTVQLTSLTLGNSGFAVQTASLTLPSALGSGKITLEGVKITGDGLVIGSGTFELPDITLASGKLTLSQAYATLEVVGSVYRLSAQGTLAIDLPENGQTIQITFAINGDGNLEGTISALTLNMASTTLALSQITLSNSGLAATNATLQLPPGLGGATMTVNEVQITGQGLTFGGAGLDVTLPNFSFGGYVTFAQNMASLSITAGGSSYLLTVQSQLGISLPDNAQQQSVSFTLAGEAGSYDLSGTISGLTLSVAGLTLGMSDIAIDNEGLSVATATLTLPEGLGGGTVTVSEVSITADGLALGPVGAEISLPDFQFGGSAAPNLAGRPPGLASLDWESQTRQAPLALRNNLATLEIVEDHFVFSVSSTLHISLPDNAQTTEFSFTISKDGNSYRLSGTLSQLSLNVAGSSLAMTSLELNNDGLYVGSAKLTLPPSIGGSATLNDISVTAAGLSIGSGEFTLPDITFGGDGSQLKIANPSASLEVSGSSYVLSARGTLQLRLPNNSQDINLTFTIRGGQFDASLSSLSLTVAGTALALQSIDFDNAGLHVASASITLPASLGGASGTLSDVNITEDGLSIGAGKFTLPDIKIGDGSKVKISSITAELAVAGSNYTLSAGGTLNLNLPGNTQDITVSFTMDSSGNMSASLDQITLTVAGSTLTMKQVTLNNSGLAVDMATLQLPPSLGGTSGTVKDVRITKDGLTIASGSFTLPDINIGDGSKVRLNNPTATISAAAGGYTFGINGTLQLRLPQNSQDISLTASMNTAGQIGASLSQLTLKLASVELQLTNVSFTNSGLSVAQGTLRLPASLGGASGIVNNVTIDKDGLNIGGAGATFAFPDFKLGSSSGFSVTGVQATLVIAGDKTYKITLAGTVQISVPGTSASATGSISVDSQGQLSGSVQSFSLTVAGLELQVTDVQINGDTLSAASASLKVPSEWGGVSAAVYNVTISPGGGVQIGGGSFTLPDVQAGGFTVKSVYGSLKRVGNGYEISGGGKFGVPGLGGGGSCAIGVDVTVYVNGAGETVFELAPSADHDVDPEGFVKPLGSVGPAGLSLRDVKLGLYGCTIPIGSTGFGLTRVEGRVTLSSGSTRISIGVSVESTALRVAGYAALRGDIDMSMATSPSEFGLAGAIYVFAFKAGELNVKITESDGFRGTLWIEAIVARGRFSVHAWSRYGRFHLTGSAVIQIGIPRGKIWSGCIPYPCCSSGCRWVSKWWGGYWSCWVDCHWCQSCITVPPGDWILGNVNAEFGEFRAGSGSAFGFKGWVSVMGYSAGFYVDNRGSLTFGNVDQYRLVDSVQVALARQMWQAKVASGQALSTEPWEYEPFTFLPSGDILVSVPLTQTTDVIFSLSRNRDVPQLTLITPGGVKITPDNLPANITYTVSVTDTVGIPPQMAQMAGVSLYQDTPKPGMALQVIEKPLELCQVGPLNLAALAGDPQGRVRLVHAVPDGPPLDVLVDDALAFANAPFTRTTGYRSLAVGPHTLKIVPAGATAPVLASITLTVEADRDYTVIALGELASVELQVLADDNSLPEAGQTRLRFVHASPDAPALDMAIENNLLLFGNMSFKGMSDYRPLDAGTYDLEVRVTSTVTEVLNVPGVELAEGTVNTIIAMGLMEGEPALQLVTSVDATRPGRVRVIHASHDAPPLDVLVNDVSLFSSVAFSQTTQYLPLAPGSYTVKFVPAGDTGPVLASTTLAVESKKDYTVVAVGAQASMDAVVLADDNTSPARGQARLRFVHLSPEVPAGGQPLDVAVQNGPLLFSNVPYKGASNYLPLATGSYTVEVRVAGTSTVVQTIPAVALDDSTVYTFLAMTELVDGTPTLLPVFNPDSMTQRITQEMYTVHQAQAGNWFVKLSGELSPEHNYLLSVLGSSPPPALSQVSAISTGGQSAQVRWRLTSPVVDTRVSIYATQEPITYTVVITQTDNTTTTLDLPLFTGILLARGVSSPVDGKPYTYNLDVSQLESGTYWLWVEAEDGRNPPVQTYAVNPNTGDPQPIVVQHALLSGSLPGNPQWDADIEVTPGYRQLDVRWDRHPHPDVDEYVLYISTAPLAATRAITVGDTTEAFLTALDAGRTYYLSVAACDHHTDRSVRSKEVDATTGVAEFDLTGPSDPLSIVGGSLKKVEVNLTTALDPYPEPVGLYALPPQDGAGDGIVVLFETTLVMPTVQGTAVTIAISTTHSLPGGEYLVSIVAYGGGVERTLNLRVTVLEPLFALDVVPATVTLSQGQSAQVVVSATGLHGENDPIHLHLQGAPPGLEWAFSSEAIYPEMNVTLTLTDTHISEHGQYQLHVLGEDGENTVGINLALAIVEPEFDIVSLDQRLQVQMGEVAVFALDVIPQNGWSRPVTLTLDAHTVPMQTAVGFLEMPLSALGQEAQQASPAQIIVTPPRRVFLVVVTTPNTPQGLYLLRVCGEGSQIQRSVWLGLQVREAEHKLYLPLVMCHASAQ